MALESASLLVLLMAAQVLPSVSGCNRAFYERMINDLCLAKFKFDMGGMDRGLWCSWPDTTDYDTCVFHTGMYSHQAHKKTRSCWIKHIRAYEGLTNCTYQVALRVDCFWPNQIVDRFFMQIHRIYFHDCALTGRLLHDPPTSILAPFIAVPVLVTLLMTALVVWRSKRTEGVL